MSSDQTTPHATDMSKRLRQVREEIDQVDRDIVRLLNTRASLSMEVGRLKAGSDDLIFKPSRERQVLDNLKRTNEGPIPFEHLEAIYSEIFSSSRSLQRPQTVAYLGPEGTFSYFAAVEFLGKSVAFQPKAHIEDAFKAVTSREAELAVIPLENSLEGTVGQSLDHFMRYDVAIQAEIFCRISHSLLSRSARLSDVTAVYSHPQPLAQCSRWLRANLPGARIIPTESTAAAARRVQDEDNGAAIGHWGLAGLLDLKVLATAIEDLPDNWTRFVVISPVGHEPKNREPGDKTSILFSLPDKPGALANVLNILARQGINMKKLESRPMRGEKWKYVFFADLECDLENEQTTGALAMLAEVCNRLRVLGSYPSGPYLDVAAQATPQAASQAVQQEN